MTPETLAARYPRLYHLTAASAVPSILRHGLLPASDLATLFEIPVPERAAILANPRPNPVHLTHPSHGQARLTDNSPLRVPALAACLQDGLTPADWLAMLNARVFFWVREADAAHLAGARRNRAHDRAVLVFDTLGLARAHAAVLELCPINSGATLRRPARRGLATFAPLATHPGRRCNIREVTARGTIPDAAAFLVATQWIGVGGRSA